MQACACPLVHVCTLIILITLGTFWQKHHFPQHSWWPSEVAPIQPSCIRNLYTTAKCRHTCFLSPLCMRLSIGTVYTVISCVARSIMYFVPPSESWASTYCSEREPERKCRIEFSGLATTKKLRLDDQRSRTPRAMRSTFKRGRLPNMPGFWEDLTTCWKQYILYKVYNIPWVFWSYPGFLSSTAPDLGRLSIWDWVGGHDHQYTPWVPH